MIIKYDSLNRSEDPMLIVCGPGCILKSDGSLSNASGVLTYISDDELTLNFNATSELNFRAYKVKCEDPDEQKNVDYLFKTLGNRRLIYIDDIGFFVITSVTDGRSDGIRYKDITAESCEVELENKTLPYIEEGTYQFTTMINTVLSSSALWSLGEVDSTVTARFRTFEETDSSENVLSFLLGKMQDAYECIFEFDISNRIINVYDQDGYADRHHTDIHITDRDIIDSMDISETGDDIYTALSVFGENELSINAVNPLGTSVIYDFSYYLDWMPDDLAEKVESWQDLISSSFDDYYSLNTEYYDVLTDITNINLELEKLNIQLTQYKRARDNVVAEAGSDEIVDYNAIIVAAGGEPIDPSGSVSDILARIDVLIEDVEESISEQEEELADKTEAAEELEEQIDEIRESVQMETYFTESELEELNNYIVEGDYTDEYVTVTDSMDYSDRLAQMRILYDRGLIQLSKVSSPSQEFSVDVESFVFEHSFKDWTEQLETGCLVNVEIDPDDVAELFLTQIICNFDDKNVKLTFGNRYNKYDTKSLFENALGDIKKTANSLSAVKDILTPITDGTFLDMELTLENARNLNKAEVLASTDQEIIIDDTGYTGRKTVGYDLKGNPVYGAKQIKINHQNIVFTDDSWDSSKLAIGDLILPDGSRAYGINSEVLIGNLIMGKEMNISSGEGADQTGFIIDGDGVHVYHAGEETITLDAKTGKITARSGYIGNGSSGFTISDNGLYNGVTSIDADSKVGDGIYVGVDGINIGNGRFKVTDDGKLYSSEGYFEGNIYAKNLLTGTFVNPVTGETVNAEYIVNNQIANYTIQGSTKIQQGSVTGGSGGCIEGGGITSWNTNSYLNTGVADGYSAYDVTHNEASCAHLVAGRISTGSLTIGGMSIYNRTHTHTVTCSVTTPGGVTYSGSGYTNAATTAYMGNV